MSEALQVEAQMHNSKVDKLSINVLNYENCKYLSRQMSHTTICNQFSFVFAMDQQQLTV